ncbi:MFS transporter [Pseudorhodoferax sp.]|uniref:MFS transporter n=1 Tax=Pseudorhodoferax sp. TaxID=1993553 RepID=UPI0039E2CFA6
MKTHPLHQWQHRQKQRLLIALICGLVGVEFLESGMFVFAAAPIMKAIDAAPQKFALVQMAFAVGNIFMVATQQWMTRHMGYRRYLMLALVLFGLGDVGSALATNLPEMVVARMLQGMGGGAFFLSTRVLIPLLFSVPMRPLASRCFLLTIFGMGVVAPALAAVLVDAWGWQWIFWIQAPIVVVLAVGVQRLMPRHLGKSAEPVRWSLIPIVLLLLAVGLVQWVFSEADHGLLEQPQHLALAAMAGITLLGLFSLHQWRHDEPLLHLRDLANPGFMAGMGLFAAYYFIVNFNNYLFPQYAERGLGLPVVTTGWLNSFSGLVTFVAVVIYSRYSARVENKRPMMIAGCLCMAASAWWMALLPVDAPIAALCAPLAAKGLFGVLMILPVSALTWRALGDTHFAKGYQAKNMMRQMMISLASAAAAVALHSESTAQHARLAQAGAGAPPAPHLGAQAVFLAGQDLYVWIAVMALLAAVVVATQKRLR